MKFNQQILLDYLAITLGCLLLAAGISIFTIDARIIPGGVSGIAIALNFLTNDWISVGLAIWIMNLPLYLWGVKVLGKEFGVRTFFGFSVSALFIDLLRGDIPGMAFIRCQDIPTIQNMLANDFLLYISTGAILMGIGLGIVFKFRGTTGGVDIIAAIAQKRLGLKPGQVFMSMDFFIVALGGVIIQIKDLSPDKPVFTLCLYSFILIVGSCKLVDSIIDGFDYANSAVIISQRYDEISKVIMETMDRGATALHGKGLYMNVEREILFTVVTRREVPLLVETVKGIDPHAFVIVNNVHEVLGEGFRPRI